MFAFNRISQTVIFSIYFIIVMVNTISNPGRFGQYAALFGMIALVPFGLSQLGGSILAYADKGAKSKLKRHLQLTLAVLGLFFLSGILELVGFDDASAILIGIAFISSIALMFYYWYVIFIGYKKPGKMDSQSLSETHGVESLE